MSKKILCIDIRKKSIAAVLINSSLRETHVEAHEYIDIPENDDIKTETTVALKSIIENMDITGASCVISFPPGDISYRNIEIPFKDKKKIRQIIPFEMEPVLPYSVEELFFDFFSINIPNRSGRGDLIAAGILNTDLKLLLNILNNLKIDPEAVTVGGLSSAISMMNYMDINRDFIFADIEENGCTLFIIVSGNICFIRSFRLSSNSGLSETKELTSGILRTIYAFEELFDTNLNIDDIIISGNGADNSDLKRQLIDATGADIKLCDISAGKGLVINNHLKKQWNPLLMNDALALGLNRINGNRLLNFRRGRFAVKNRMAEFKSGLIKSGILAIVVIMLAFADFYVEFYFMEKRLENINGRIIQIFSSTFPQVKRIVDPLQQMTVKIKQAKKQSFILNNTNIRKIEILNEISCLIPKDIDVNFTRLVIGPETLMVAGDTETFNDVDHMKSSLAKAAFSKKITISSSSKDKSGRRVRFKLKIRLAAD